MVLLKSDVIVVKAKMILCMITKDDPRKTGMWSGIVPDMELQK